MLAIKCFVVMFPYLLHESTKIIVDDSHVSVSLTYACHQVFPYVLHKSTKIIIHASIWFLIYSMFLYYVLHVLQKSSSNTKYMHVIIQY